VKIRRCFHYACCALLATSLAASTAKAQDLNAFETKQQLTELLRQYPPSLWRVLQIDPGLLNNKEYMAPYPALDAFATKHPEIYRSANFFLGAGRPGFSYESEEDQTARAIAEFTTVILAIATVAGSLTWIIKSIIDYRRWHSVSKSQIEVHSRLMDRFTSNEDLLAYIQSPAGQRFLEAGPIAMSSGARHNAPVMRILWSAQVGMVLGFGGFGLIFASSRLSIVASQPFFVLGVLAIALGIGFMVSALASYVISRGLGLFAGTSERPTT
jgi:hypothetical protein